ncbi:MAG: hypothetical protein KAS16_01945 [Thermoplasmata archaeon]|nr:hypothetical protein [Thermoplasmata archaeon]
MNVPKQVISILLVASIMCASIAIVSQNVSSLDVGGDIISNLASLPNGVKINDVAWNTNGSMAMAVGSNDTGGSNAFWYYPKNDTWVGLAPYCIEVGGEFVYGPSDGANQGPFNILNVPVYNYTFFYEDGVFTEIDEGVDYTFDPVTGIINTFLPVPVGTNLFCWYNYSARELFGVDYDHNASKFGAVGTNPDASQSAALYTNPGDPQFYEISKNNDWPSQDLKDIKVDCWGNMLVVGPNDYVRFFRLSDDSWYQVSDADTGGWDYETVDFEAENKRFYLAGGNGGGGAIAYTDPVSTVDTIPAWHHDYDTVANMTRYPIFKSIAWNNDPAKFGGGNYALLVGESNLTLIMPFDAPGPSMSGAKLPGIDLADIAFEEHSWKVATIVGYNSTFNLGYIFQFSAPGSELTMIHGVNGEQYYCVDYRPPSSPTIGLVIGAGSVSQLNLNAFDINTKLTVLTEQPHVFDIDMWDASDAGETSLLNSRVDVQNTYTFYTELNYSVGGVDKFWDNANDIRVSLWGWYDEGKVGLNSAPEPTWATAENRTRQFSILWEEGLSGVPTQGTANMVYPVGSPGTDEFLLDSWWIDPTGYGVDGFTWHMYFNITFNNQTRAADGDNFANLAAGNINDQNLALNDPNSWDFRFQIYDQVYPTALNESLEEFGVYRFTNISVLGNPTGNAPPGTNGYALAPHSFINYSANIPHYLNVSISDLERMGGGGTIIATEVSANIVSTLANDTNSQMNGTAQYILGADTEVGVWGNASLAAQYWSMPAPMNGTSAHGPWGSDFNNFEATQIQWYIDVPAATPEGMYETTITFTIGYY